MAATLAAASWPTSTACGERRGALVWGDSTASVEGADSGLDLELPGREGEGSKGRGEVVCMDGVEWWEWMLSRMGCG